MKDLVISLARSLVQKGLGIVALWLLAHGIDMPDAVTNWVVLTTIGLAVFVYTAVVRFLETRQSGAARLIAKVLMLGLSGGLKTPIYAGDTPTAAKGLEVR